MIGETGRSTTGMADVNGGRRGFMRLCGGGAAMFAGLQMLSACKDDVVGAEAVPTPPRAAATVPATYTATDADRVNFMLQIHYLLAAYLQAGVYGTTLSSALTTGSGAAGVVKGGARISFTDAILNAQLREVADLTVMHVSLLRRLAGGAVTAQPAIDITGGAGSPFQAIAQRSGATPPPANETPLVFDPYSSPTNFLQGAVALSSIVAGAMVDVPRWLGDPLATQVTALVSASAAREGTVRAALYKVAFAELALPEDERGDPTIFDIASRLSDTRDFYDGSSNLDLAIGGDGWADILPEDADRNSMRRTPEQALGILYASAASTSSGAFFPAGVNGKIRTSGANVVS